MAPSPVTCISFPVYFPPSPAWRLQTHHTKRDLPDRSPGLDSLVPTIHFFSGCVRMLIGTSAWTPGSSCVRTAYGPIWVLI